jgi:hypothetical protein
MASEIKPGPEVVFGLVGSVGTDLDFVSQCLSAALADVNYQSLTVRLSELMHEIGLDRWKNRPKVRHMNDIWHTCPPAMKFATFSPVATR